MRVVVMKKIKSVIKKARREFGNRALTYYKMHYESSKVVSNTILYESRDGKAFSDSPYAFFAYFANHPEQDDYQHTWVYDGNVDLTLAKKLLPHHKLKSVKFVKRNTKEYGQALLTSEYLINNSTFQPWFIKKENQVYVNTWHGTPLKKMGFDIEDNPKGSQNVLRNFLMADYLISPNNHMTDVFLKSYKLEGLYEGTILEGGLPRNDWISNPDITMATQLRDSGIILDSTKKVLLYTPTYRGVLQNEAADDIEKLVSDVKYLVNHVGDEYNILIKVHPFVYGKAVLNENLKGRLVSDLFDVNKLFEVTDILVTDYSSVLFDYLITKKRLIYYIWDSEDYADDRGMYFSPENLPGDVATTIVELVDAIRAQHQIRIDESIDRLIRYDDGSVTKRYVQRIFHGEKSGIIQEFKPRSQKEHLIFYPGGFLTNGITTSFINLVHQLPEEKYDITVLFGGRMSEQKLLNYNQISSKVRPLFVFGRTAMGFREQIKFQLLKKFPNKFTNKFFYPKTGFRLDANRILANTHFDTLVDFSGYSLYGSRYLLEHSGGNKLIYLHNDIVSDANRVIDGKRPLLKNVKAAIADYSRFDTLVNVSDAVLLENQKRLADEKLNSKMRVAPNVLDYNRVIERANQSSDEWVDKSKVSFVTVGRLSPEKNQKNLLVAWRDFVSKYPNSQLIIVGYGPLEAELRSFVKENKLSDSVIFTGLLMNPYPTILAADYFVFPSMWEGQGLALLEALVLHKRVIASNIPTNREILGQNRYGLVAKGTDAISILEAMSRMMETNREFEAFDFVEYNRKAIQAAEDIF